MTQSNLGSRPKRPDVTFAPVVTAKQQQALIGIGAFLRTVGLKAADWASVGDGGKPEEVGIDWEHGMLRPTCHLLLFIYHRVTVDVSQGGRAWGGGGL